MATKLSNLIRKQVSKEHNEHTQLPKYPVWDNEKLYFTHPALAVYLCPHTSFFKLQCTQWKTVQCTNILNDMHFMLAVHYISIFR